MKKIIFTIITFTLILFSGCNINQEKQENDSKIGLANPASVYCEKQGGKLELNGSIGICKFENFECEEWAYYRGECPEKKSKLGEFCGGIATIECGENLKCEHDGDFPDSGGVCVNINKITSFNECVAAGNPTTKSIPAQCTSNNQTFYEKQEKYPEEKICTAEYAPVCGEDGRTYSNKCMAGNITIAYEGKC